MSNNFSDFDSFIDCGEDNVKSMYYHHMLHQQTQRTLEEAVKKLKNNPEELKNARVEKLKRAIAGGDQLIQKGFKPVEDEVFKDDKELEDLAQIFGRVFYCIRRPNDLEYEIRLKNKIEQIAKNYNIQNPAKDPILKFMIDSSNLSQILDLCKNNKFDYETIENLSFKKQSFGEKIKNTKSNDITIHFL